MTNISESNISSGSTNWVWQKVKASDAPAGDRSAGQRPSTQGRKPRRNRRKWQTIQVQYRGGPESSWVVKVGAEAFRFPGYICIEDLMKHLLNEAVAWRP